MSELTYCQAVSRARPNMRVQRTLGGPLWPRRSLLAVAASLSLFVGGPPALGQQFQEHVTVGAVQVRVFAVDAAGKPVDDLKPEDLTLRVDGHVVPIDTLAREETPGSPITEPTPTRGKPIARATAPEPGVAPTVALMVVVDESTTGFLSRKEALAQLVRFVETDARASQFLVATYGRGSLRLDLPWTTDHARVVSVLRKLRHHLTYEAVPTGKLTSQTNVAEFHMLRLRLEAALMQALAMFPDGPMERQLLIVTGGRTLAPVLDVAGTLAGEDGSSSHGASITTGGEMMVPDASAVDAPDDPLGMNAPDGQLGSGGFELWSLVVGGALSQVGNRALEAKAIERDVALVPISTSHMEPVGYGDVASKWNKRVSGLSAEIATNQALWGLARETGGGSMILGGKAAAELARRSERPAYLLSFRYGPGEAGRFHSLRLTSNRPGVSLEYRRGFRIRTTDERILDMVVTQFVMPAEGANALSLSASLGPGRVAADHTLLTLRFSPPAGIGVDRPRAVEVVAVGRDADGAWTQPVRWAGEASAFGGGPYEVKIELGIALGSFVWSVGLRDEATSLDGYAMAPASKR
jgi:VWFA-related protein